LHKPPAREIALSDQAADGLPVRAPEPRGGAFAVGAGILASRLAGLARAAVSSAVFGVGAYADVFQTALRAPNVLQNLLGEQALSASFIPVYSRMLARGETEAARRLAGAIFGLLSLVAGAIALVGILAAEPIVALFAAGYLRDAAQVAAGEATVDRYRLAVEAVRWIFPMTGLLVLSAWALGVLNSHRRFFLSYVAPVAWNAAIVAALLWASGSLQRLAGDGAGVGRRLVLAACVGALIGGFLQFVVQLPSAWRALGGLRPTLSRSAPGVGEALAAFGPAVAGRGVVQLSSYLDQLLASLLAVGAVSALGYGQMLYLLPVSLFGQSIAAAALPELARLAPDSSADGLRSGTRSALRASAFLVLPTTVAYLAFAPIAVAGIYRLVPGRFGAGEVALVGAVLTAYALGLPASTSSRVVQSAFFALGDTRTPARIAGLRVALGTAVALPLMWKLDQFGVDRLPWTVGVGGSDLRLGALGLALGATAGAWIERIWLGRALGRRLAGFAPRRRETLLRALLALATVIPAAAVAWWLSENHPFVRAVSVFGSMGMAYLGTALALRLPEVRQVLRGGRWRS
jgi:putative peptidoglycan lipid II flippase